MTAPPILLATFSLSAMKKSASLSNTNAKALLIYSENDKLVKKSHYDTLRAGLLSKENIKLMLVKNKGHNPNYTEDAVLYLSEYIAKRNKLSAKKKLATKEQRAEFLALWDWDRMTRQDETVWNEIFECLDE